MANIQKTVLNPVGQVSYSPWYCADLIRRVSLFIDDIGTRFFAGGRIVHFISHLKDGFVANSKGTFGTGDTRKNLDLSIAGETFEIEEMYPTYMETAKFQEENNAYRSFEWPYKTEIKHKELFEKARSAVENGKDVDLGDVQVCEVCGYTLEGDAPDQCPVCGARKEKFTPYK